MSGEVNNNASINTRYAQYMDKLNNDVKSGKTTTKEAQKALLEFRKENQIGEFAPKQKLEQNLKQENLQEQHLALRKLVPKIMPQTLQQKIKRQTLLKAINQKNIHQSKNYY